MYNWAVIVYVSLNLTVSARRNMGSVTARENIQTPIEIIL